ncbi:hypothetical protein EVAR_24437_1 [Eumeta japonica]|uniref:Uncharacterized protein n=1 Tax=Eumeta variegata TaxID=151549 RepID=A0A4C1WV89_EUMVA|nr:hypothetical protein EVAR_24437_1 [Eumeta japonica]
MGQTGSAIPAILLNINNSNFGLVAILNKQEPSSLCEPCPFSDRKPRTSCPLCCLDATSAKSDTVRGHDLMCWNQVTKDATEVTKNISNVYGPNGVGKSSTKLLQALLVRCVRNVIDTHHPRGVTSALQAFWTDMRHPTEGETGPLEPSLTGGKPTAEAVTSRLYSESVVSHLSNPPVFKPS